jgi:hypothetical protein
MGQLSYLLLPEPAPGMPFVIPANYWNDLVAEIAARQNTERFEPVAGEEFDHPWKVTVSRVENDDRRWKVSVRPGTVNDDVAAIVYRKQGDPRGWQMPNDYPPRKDSGSQVDRLLIEKDQPPFLMLQVPALGEVENDSFVPVADAQRPEYFRTEERWPRSLCRAFVCVSADPTHVSAVPLEVVQLKRYRVFGGRRPARVNAQAGGWCELAWLWLLRGERPDQDELFVEQREFWCFGSLNVQPQSVLSGTSSEGFDPLSALFLQIAQAVEQNQLEAAGSIEFWTQ